MDHVANVIYPFETQIRKMQISVLTSYDFSSNIKLIGDWEMFEFILFNII
jgi:hypothetical protein